MGSGVGFGRGEGRLCFVRGRRISERAVLGNVEESALNYQREEALCRCLGWRRGAMPNFQRGWFGFELADMRSRAEIVKSEPTVIR